MPVDLVHTMNATDVFGWTPEPQGRGTMGLIWSCLITIFLCTWSAVHPNLPAQDDKARHILRRRLKYLFFALVAPEIFCVFAVSEFLDARAVQKESPDWSLAMCHYLVIGGFAVNDNGKSICLPAKKLLELFSTSVLSWPNITEAEILDRSKADWVLKSLALVQAMWFALQVIGRAVQGLSTTTLELFTLGVMFCAFFTYAAWWAKPFDVRKPIILELNKPLPQTVKGITRVRLSGFQRLSSSLLPGILGMCSAMILGALHLAAWRFHFPTEIERWLWRGSSLACIALPLLIWASLADSFDHAVGKDWGHWLFIVSSCLYILCRLYMMVEMFVILREVPADVYETPRWSQYIHSFG